MTQFRRRSWQSPRPRRNEGMRLSTMIVLLVIVLVLMAAASRPEIWTHLFPSLDQPAPAGSAVGSAKTALEPAKAPHPAANTGSEFTVSDGRSDCPCDCLCILANHTPHPGNHRAVEARPHAFHTDGGCVSASGHGRSRVRRFFRVRAGDASPDRRARTARGGTADQAVRGLNRRVSRDRVAGFPRVGYFRRSPLSFPPPPENPPPPKPPPPPLNPR